MWFKRKTLHAIPADTMRVMAIVDAGPEGELHVQRQPKPVPKPGDVLIRVAYTGVNRADLFQRLGSYRAPEGDSPLPGLEVSGSIEAIGEDVIGWSVGEKVAALTNGGGYAEYVAVPASQVLALPASLSLREAATLPEGLATAYMALMQEAEARYGERVLVHGGASGVGLLMIQVARAIGATVYATCSSPAKQQRITSLGATPLAYDSASFADSARKTIGGPVHVVIDTLGGPYMQQHLKLLAHGGRMVSLAFLEGPQAVLSMGQLLLKHLRWSGATLRNQTPKEKAAIMEGVRKQLWPLVAAGHIKPFVDAVFPLDSAREAHDRMENRLNSGKIVLEVSSHQSPAAS